MKNTTSIENLTKSEVKKAVRYFEKKHPGSAVIASGWATHPKTECDIETGFQTVSVELWNEEERESYTVYLSVCLWDRRRSFVMNDAENWYREPEEEATTNTINNNEEENTMSAVRFEIGGKYNRTGLYGGNSTMEVVSRTDSTVTFRESWVSEDSGKLCHSDPRAYAIEVERVGNVDVERVEIWEYRGSKGYMYAASEDEQWSFIEAAKESKEQKLEGRELNERVYEMLFDAAENEAEFHHDYDKIMNSIADTLNLDEETFGKIYDGFESEFSLWLECRDTDETLEDEDEKTPGAENIVLGIEQKVEGIKTRSAWERGVKEYALELLDELGYGVRHGYIEEDELENRRLLEKAMLNGASDWKQYSEGGCALCYDWQIANRLCAPWELRKTDNGRKDPNPRESWIDVQSRALFQAAQMILRVAF